MLTIRVDQCKYTGSIHFHAFSWARSEHSTRMFPSISMLIIGLKSRHSGEIRSIFRIVIELDLGIMVGFFPFLNLLLC